MPTWTLNHDRSSKRLISRSIPKNLEILLLTFVSSFCFSPFFKKNAAKPNIDLIPPLPTIREDELLTNAKNVKDEFLDNFPYNVLKAATHKFDNKYLIGEGGFGQVYRAWIDVYTMTAAKPGEGLQVAIKKLKKGGQQGDGEWRTELTFLSQCNHPNVVKLMGSCSHGDHRILVYEYMARGSLESYLIRKGSSRLNWSRRVKIAVGAARGLAYLHNARKPVIHRDLKSSNVLLDKDFTAKISDFGLAKFGPQGDKSHVSTRVLGTRGYFAPEYLATGHLTLMTDVYGFGVLLLEILSGSGAIREHTDGFVGNLTCWAKPYLCKKSELLHVIDPRIRGKFRMEEACKFANIILRCTDANPKSRPTMTEVVATLEQLEKSMDYNWTLVT
ncbi:putative serine/threonine-protein kinase PBL11 [Tasmannia lanceolata]|uniref:putative serine/threonine-protein kinase PBL11 n=1 Tax=Tasmannia lanceolata TaxID=3420 RepID=UPI004063E76E